MLFFLLFSLELLLLFFFSRFVTSALSQIIFRIVRRESTTMWILAILFFPGTVVHELAHFFIAIVLFVPVGTIEFFPQKHGESIKLGSVAIGKTDPFRRALIGLAPIVVGLSLLFYSCYSFISFPLIPWYINIIVLLCIVFEIGNTMFSSKRDVEGIPALVLVLGVFLLVGYVLGVRIPESAIQYLQSATVQMFFQQLCFYLLIPLVLDGGILVLSRLIKR